MVNSGYRDGLSIFKIIFISLICTLSVRSAGQQLINPHFSRFTINDGLSQGLVYSITQDKKGFMWFGTKDGLNRYDGYEFRIYSHDPFDSTSLSDNTVTSLYTDSKGRLWVGTYYGGLNLYRPEKDCFIHFTSTDLGGANIHAITEDKAGNLWVATYGNGLFQIIFNQDKHKAPYSIKQYLHQENKPESINGNLVIDVYGDSQDRIWVSTTAGNFQYVDLKQAKIKFQTPRYTIYNVAKTILPGRIKYDLQRAKLSKNSFTFYGGWFFQDNQRRLWIGMPSGLCLLDEVNSKLLRFDPLLPGQNRSMIRSISKVTTGYSDTYKSLWIGLFGGLGIFDMNDYSLQLINHDPGNSESLLPGVVLSIYQDKSGCVWLGSNGYGLSKYNARITQFEQPEFQTSDGKIKSYNLSTRSFCETPHFLLIGCQDGLWKVDKRTGLMLRVPLKKLPESSNFIFHIKAAQDGKIWLATDTGLILYSPESDESKTFSPDIIQDGQADNRIFKLYDDSTGHIWCLTAYTFSSFEIASGKFTHFFYNHKKINRFSEPTYGDIYRDKKREFWLATGDGLYTFSASRNTFRNYVNIPTDTASLSINVVRSVLPDPKYPEKFLWLGTAGGGLNRFDLQTRKFKAFTIADGLPNNVVYGILADEKGFLWLSTNKGISRFDPSTGKFQSFTAKSGLQSNEFNSGAFYKNESGKLYFGGINGFNAFDPDKIKFNTYIPDIVFTGLRLANRMASIHDKNSLLEMPVFESRQITLPYYENNIGIQVAGMDFTNPGHIQYEYKLEGINAHWVAMGTNRMITFSNLSPRKYVLHVRAVREGNQTDYTGASLLLDILPPWWRTWWAYTIYVLLLLTILYISRKYELKRIRLKNSLKLKQLEAQKLKELDQLKSRFFANISHEFRTPLTLLIGPLEDLLQDGDPAKFTALVPGMYRNSKRLMQLINQLLDLSRLDTRKYIINTSRQDIIPFLQQLVNSFSSLADRKNISLNFDVESSLMKRLSSGNRIFYFDADIIEKIVTNLLSNAFKFTSDGGRITVSVSLSKTETEGIKITVQDTGRGIPEDKIQHIFDRFYQASNALNERTEGSGIGLALVQELIELHQGQIDVSSKIHEGSVFNCYFPFNNRISSDIPEQVNNEVINYSHVLPSEAEDPLPAHSSPPEGKLHILVVEDHPDVRKYIVEKLLPDYYVTEASNGKDGKTKAIQFIPDLIISDVMMPEMDGFELCASLKTDDRTCHIPVILITARAEDADRITGLEMGADAYLIKPFNAKELLVRVRKLIELRMTLRTKFSDRLIVRPSEVTVSSRDRLFIEKVMSIVESHLGDVQFSVDDLGQAVHMSRSQINRKLKAIVNQSPQQFIESVRLQRAIELLKKDTATIAEIAYQVGYEDPGYFTKVFKKHFGILPSEKDKFPA